MRSKEMNMRLRDAVRRQRDDPTYCTVFCRETGEYAIVEVLDPNNIEIVSKGQIQQRGHYWYFVENDKQVCSRFGYWGSTMAGENAPSYAADQVYKTYREFHKNIIDRYHYRDV